MKSEKKTGQDMVSISASDYPIKRLTRDNNRYVVLPLPQREWVVQPSYFPIIEDGIILRDPPTLYPGLRIDCRWSDDIIPILEKHSIESLYLYGPAWGCDDYSFLSRIPPLKHLCILSSSINRIDYISDQTELTQLSIYGCVKDHMTIDFRRIHHLKRLVCSGDVVNPTLSSCTELTHFSVDELWKINTLHFEELTNLRELTIKNSSISDLSFLNSLQELVELSMDNCRSIQDFQAISSVQNLRWLSLRGVILRDLSFLSHMSNLRILVIDTGGVESLKPIKELINLKAVSLGGLIHDNDLTPIGSLPNLSMLRINNKRHYPYRINNHWDWNDYGSFRHEWLTPR